jgi:dynein heavy chain
MQGISREDFISGVARDIQTKIPQPFDLPLLKKDIGIPSPTQVVLIQELERWNSVLVVSGRRAMLLISTGTACF